MKITAGTETSIIVVVTKTDTDRTPLELINNLSPNKQTNKGILLTQKTVIMGELHHTLKMCPCYAKCSIIISIKLLLSHDFLRSIVETTIACEQALLFGQAKRASRERAIWASSPFLCVLARPVLLAQTGELASRLRRLRT